MAHFFFENSLDFITNQRRENSYDTVLLNMKYSDGKWLSIALTWNDKICFEIKTVHYNMEAYIEYDIPC